MSTPHRALQFFFPRSQLVSRKLLGEGKINDTWLVEFKSEQPIVLQRVPSAVFPQIKLVMENIGKVLTQLNQWQETTNQPQELLSLLTSPGGANLYLDENGDGWRCFSYISGSRTQEELVNTQQAQDIGSMLGVFHKAVQDLSPSLLHEPLPDFHNTLAYLKKYDQANAKRSKSCEKSTQCTVFIEKFRSQVDHFIAIVNNLSHQVIHGDPKVSNFLFAATNDQVISIIDLDTVQPGLLLHDLGDCLRSCCNQSGEEHGIPQNTTFSADYFQAVLCGYAKAAPGLLKPSDINVLSDAVGVICFELGVRFFTDHLNDDIYFKTNRQGQNLDRALIQFYLAESIYGQQQDLDDIVAQVFECEGKN